MMIKNELLAQQLEWKPDQKQRVRRVVSMDHINPIARRHIYAYHQAPECKIGVLCCVPKESLELGPLTLKKRLPFARCFLKELHFGNAIHPNSADELGSFLPLPLQANHRDIVTFITE